LKFNIKIEARTSMPDVDARRVARGILPARTAVGIAPRDPALSTPDGVESDCGYGEFEVVAQARVELATPAFSVRCSTN
jgi:hypothetical protein